MSEDKPRVTLDHVLANLIAQSQDVSGGERSQRLNGGMFVGIAAQPGEFTLNIWRYNVSPSAVEWTTTLAHLPEMYRPIKAIVPRDYGRGRLRGLIASWPVPGRLF